MPPYEILDKILHLHLEEGLDLDEIVKKGFERDTVKKVFTMLKIAEYKRRQAPIGPKISKSAFGIDYKIPITNAFI